MGKVCFSMTKHAPTTSNLAGLIWHVICMLKEIIKGLETLGNNDYASSKISLVGKTRVTCGALNVLRIFVHDVIATYIQDVEIMKDSFLYKNRNDPNQNQETSYGLVEVLLDFIGLCAHKEISDEIYRTAELYDCITFIMNLLLVMCSTQLYQPLTSSFQMEESVRFESNYFMDKIMIEARRRQSSLYQEGSNTIQLLHRFRWSSHTLLQIWFQWMTDRPQPPRRCIAGHSHEMTKMVAIDVKGEKVGPDGLFENHAVVLASSTKKKLRGGIQDQNFPLDRKDTTNRDSSRLLLDATNKVLALSTKLILLPFRLMVLALKALGQTPYVLGSATSSSGNIKMKTVQELYGSTLSVESSLTNDVLWLSDSPIADLGTSIFLILTNSMRATNISVDTTDKLQMVNPFRFDLSELGDNRWEITSSSVKHLSSITEDNHPFETVDLIVSSDPVENYHVMKSNRPHMLTINFEHMFECFEGTLHTEIGALALYTLMHSSPLFTSSLAVRNDIERLVMPLLRTLYFATSVSHHISGRTVLQDNKSAVDVKEFPFRSPSHLYLITILLLMFSQDSSFAPVSFRRIHIKSVIWYKERQLKDITLGSLLISSLVRCITFNLNRMSDPFFLSNCCAILLNLSPHIENIHSYAALRLVEVLVSTIKRYTVLVIKNGGKPASEEDVTSLLGMYSESCRILIQVVKHALRRKVIESNLNLVYALVYHQRDLNKILNAKTSPFQVSDTEKISEITSKAFQIIQDASARTAEQSMEALSENISLLKKKSGSKGDLNSCSSSLSSTTSDWEDFKFTYEEESDAEIFFVPYVWEVIVCTVTSGSLEWNRSKIKVFQINNHVHEGVVERQDHIHNASEYSQDVADIV